MLNRRTVDQIWERFGVVELDLFSSQESTQGPLWFSLSHPTSLGIDALAHPWPDMKLYAFPLVKLNPAVLRRVKTCGLRLLLVAPFWPSQTWFSELISLMESDPWEIPVRKDLLGQLQGRIWHPRPKIWKLADHRPPLALDLSDGVRETIDRARALSTRMLYSSKWRVFESWCLANAVDPVSSRLVQCWSSYSISFRLERPLPP